MRKARKSTSVLIAAIGIILYILLYTYIIAGYLNLYDRLDHMEQQLYEMVELTKKTVET